MNFDPSEKVKLIEKAKSKLSKKSQSWLEQNVESADRDYFVPLESGIVYQSDVIEIIAQFESEIRLLKSKRKK